MTCEQLVVCGVELLVDHITSRELFDATAPNELLEVGMQGPPGSPGSSADAPYLTLVAAGPIGGHRVIRSASGLAAYADSSELGDANLVLGISRAAAADGQPAYVQTGGLMTEPGWAWLPDVPVFCGTNGALTQTPPEIGFALIVGIATASNQIFIGAKMPLILQE